MATFYGEDRKPIVVPPPVASFVVTNKLSLDKKEK
jgi:hypothetical protein